jgi:hypothetical protein
MELGSWDKAVAAEAAGVNPFKAVSAAGVRQLSGSPMVLGGVYEDNAASVQPARLVRACTGSPPGWARRSSSTPP